MQISLSKSSDVPVHEQLAEQLVFLITTGALSPGEQLPSVRALAGHLKIHRNTVSKSFQELVERGWLKRRKGSRMCVEFSRSQRARSAGINLDELMDQTIRRAGELGFSLQELRKKVMERISAQPPDHILVIEKEIELRTIICEEIRLRMKKRVNGCTAEELARAPELALDAQVVAPFHAADFLTSLLPANRKCLGLTFANAGDQLDRIRGLSRPSVIGVASLSRVFLKTARSLLAPAVSSRHSVQVVLVPPNGELRLDGFDVVLCDSVIMSRVRCRQKIPYQLISARSLEDLSASLSPANS
jgi:DNA-binding transcriptional regulator YhcF (GntR family)